VCRSSREPGGPRRCPAHARARYETSSAAVAALEQLVGQRRHRIDTEWIGDRYVPPSVGADDHARLWRYGIRPWGRETSDDYALISRRAGDLEEWGFTAPRRLGFGVETFQLLDDEVVDFYDELTDDERAAITSYTEGWSPEMNRAITGDEPPTVDPHARAMAEQVVQVIQRFSARARSNPYRPAATVVRGVPVPAEWENQPRVFFDTAYPVGARVETGRITSTTLSVRHAVRFADRPENKHGYLMVIQTRDGLPVQPVAGDPFEDETILPPGSYLRCVHVDHTGIAGKPTVYLVEEDLVADEQTQFDRASAS
jgi:hypothetical protein